MAPRPDLWICPDCATDNDGNFVCVKCKRVRPLEVTIGSPARSQLSDSQIAELKASRSPRQHRPATRSVAWLAAGVAVAIVLLVFLVSTYLRQGAKDLASTVSLQAADLGAGWEEVRPRGSFTGAFLGPATNRCIGADDPNRGAATGHSVAYRQADTGPNQPRFAGSRARVYASAAMASSSLAWFNGAAFRECLARSVLADTRAGFPAGITIPDPAAEVTTVAGSNGAIPMTRIHVLSQKVANSHTLDIDVAILRGGRVVDVVYFVSVHTPPLEDLQQSALQLISSRLPSR